MKAGHLLERLGERLVGRVIHTEMIGDCPGGWVTVKEIRPDLAVPEIVFTVRHPKHGEIGVFESERVRLLPLVTEGS